MAERIFKRKIYDKILDWKRANIQFWAIVSFAALRASFWPKATRPTACCSSTSTSRAANRCAAGGLSSATAHKVLSSLGCPLFGLTISPFIHSPVSENRNAFSEIFFAISLKVFPLCADNFSSLRR